MKFTSTKSTGTGKKPSGGPLRLVTDNLSAEDKELLSYFHGIAHEFREHVLAMVEHVSINRPLAPPDSKPQASGIQIAASNGMSYDDAR